MWDRPQIGDGLWIFCFLPATSYSLGITFFTPLRGYKIKRPQKDSKFKKRFKEPHAYPNKLSKFYKAVKYATYFPDFLLN